MHKPPLDRLQQLYLRVFDTDFMRRIVRNSGYLVSATVLAAGIGFFQAGFQFRVLGVAGAGLFGVLGTFTNVLNRLTAFRIDEMVVRYVRLYEERGQHQKAAAVYKLAALLESLGGFSAFILVLWLAPLGVRLFSDQPGTERGLSSMGPWCSSTSFMIALTASCKSSIASTPNRSLMSARVSCA
jgi:hypothetical protein